MTKAISRKAGGEPNGTVGRDRLESDIQTKYRRITTRAASWR